MGRKITEEVKRLTVESIEEIEALLKLVPDWEKAEMEVKAANAALQEKTSFEEVDRLAEALTWKVALYDQAVYEVGLQDGMALAKMVYFADDGGRLNNGL